MRKKILKIVQNNTHDVIITDKSVQLSEHTILYGDGGLLESLDLVRLIIAVETDLFDEYGHSVTLADERAMSQRNSPFRTIKSLTDYIEILLQERNDA